MFITEHHLLLLKQPKLLEGRWNWVSYDGLMATAVQHFIYCQAVRRVAQDTHWTQTQGHLVLQFVILSNVEPGASGKPQHFRPPK